MNSKFIITASLTNQPSRRLTSSIFTVATHLVTHIILHFFQYGRMTDLIIVIMEILQSDHLINIYSIILAVLHACVS